VIDGSFSHAAERAAARGLAVSLGVPHVTVWCDAPDAVIAARLRDRQRDAGEVSDGRLELLPAHRAAYETPKTEAATVAVDTTGDARVAAETVLATLSWTRRSPASGPAP
jgi:predicted kinase